MRANIFVNLGLAAAMLLAGSVAANAAPRHHHSSGMMNGGGICGQYPAAGCGHHGNGMVFRHRHHHAAFDGNTNNRFRHRHVHRHHHFNGGRDHRWCRYHRCGSHFRFGFGIGLGYGAPYYGAYYPGYGTYGGYYYYPAYRHYGVSCRRAAQIVYNHGFGRVRTVSCGRYYDRFSAVWRGHRVMVTVRVSNGAIVAY